MHVSSPFNPNQVVALNQGYQSGATAFPISFRPNMHGNTVAYSFNPYLSQSSAFGLNPAFSNSAFNPILNQSMAWGWNPMMAQNIFPGSGVSNWSPLVNPAQAMSMGFNTLQVTSGLAQMRVDLHETNSDIVCACELPNVSLNDLNLTVTDDSLSICCTAFAGNRATSLFRTVALPTSIKSEQVEATYSNGILEIRAPKSDMVTRRKVKVNIS
ncbi:MAG: Hsp20/alpha crystallin family protein [Pelotomaculum sp. PtaU1.Bin035]|nr:MAG: Hsp20/alpha crystallin family protein [Pelotomaculum sp. PtaU1.Bin035]